MKYEISLSDDGNYLEIRLFQFITGDLEREFAERAIRDANKHKVSRFLVDVRGTPNIASFVDQYFFGHREMAQFGLDKSSRIAILTGDDDHTHHFIETVLVNAGYRCRSFRSRDAAVDWLEG